MPDPRVALGYEVHAEVKGPFTVVAAKRNGTGTDGGSLDTALVASLEDGTRVVIGEIWAACPDDRGGKTRIDAENVARCIARTMNGEEA